MKVISIATVAIILTIVPAHSATLSGVDVPADALRVEFISPDLKADQSLTVGVVVTRSTGAVQVIPTSTPKGMSYNAATQEFSGIPANGKNEFSVHVTDAGTSQTADGILTLNVVPR
ncbi:UNVERIFIED_ORG: hypothetical protein GGI63_004647 [Rhizobium esperanzae]